MPSDQNLRVLLVDDDKTIRNIVGEMLAALGFDVRSAQNGLEALYVFTNDNGFDLVLTDINMPLMDGWQLSGRIKAIKPNIPIIAITGENQKAVLSRLPDTPISQALFKPFNLTSLRETLENQFDM